jgi:hypothetical protein
VEGSTAGRAHNWCMACRLDRWRAASWHANASDATDGSPSPMSMGGGRSSSGRRCNRRPPWLCDGGHHARASLRVVDHRSASRPIFTASASIASPPRIGCPPASCPNDVCGAGVFDTLRATATCQGALALGARAMHVLRIAPIGRRTLAVHWTMVGPRRPPPFPPPVVAGDKDKGGTKEGGVAAGWQEPRMLRPLPRSLLKLCLGSASCPARRASSSPTR